MIIIVLDIGKLFTVQSNAEVDPLGDCDLSAGQDLQFLLRDWRVAELYSFLGQGSEKEQFQPFMVTAVRRS